MESALCKNLLPEAVNNCNKKWKSLSCIFWSADLLKNFAKIHKKITQNHCLFFTGM